MLPLALRQAFKTGSTGRPGPVNVDVPLDVFMETADRGRPEPEDWRHGINSRIGGAPEKAREAARAARPAERPVFLVGNGVALSEAGAGVRRPWPAVANSR